MAAPGGAAAAALWLSSHHTDNPLITALSVAASVLVPAVAGQSLVRRRREPVTAADRITLLRAALTGVLGAAFVLILAAELPSRTWTVLVLAALATTLDAVDGWVARRTEHSTQAGARFDAETDAATLLVLSALLAVTLGWWVLLIGLMRYAFLAVAQFRPLWRQDLPYSLFRRVVAAVQAVAVVVGLGPIVPLPLATALAAAALSALVLSFVRDVLKLERGERNTGPTAERQG